MCMEERHLTESEEDYLESVLMITKEKGVCHSIDIVNHLQHRKSSVSVALSKLEEKGYLRKEGRDIILSDAGMKAAMHVYERHLFFKNALMELGVDEHQAEEEACAIEHDISNDTFRRIQTRVQELRGEQ
ncbi:metal-dependent transcriptional regulator [Sharpea azabuensis]|uniref:Metal-dependent transcriptional regulator n=2 Tax=Sharpea porci TaxID=2652286 RepID=A0A844FV76_9FIRM|nr:metal-dependent transcriptional regulator [Sharpea porci]